MTSSHGRLCALLFTALTLPAQAQSVLHATAAHDTQRATHSPGVPANLQTRAQLRIRLTQADRARRGELWLVVTADTSGATPAHVTLRIPLSSTEDAYGESRSCKVAPDGTRDFTFTAGLDEQNFIPFAPAPIDKPIDLSLNKYLCRALASAFDCNGHATTLPADWTQWHLGKTSAVILSSDAPATLSASPITLQQTPEPFDPTQCAVIAPSNGVCCVGGRSTDWHCGGKPDGLGWHQVSGDCFHRENGASCRD